MSEFRRRDEIGEEGNKIPRLRFRVLRKVAILPTLITLGNGICGMISVVSVMNGKILEGTWLIFLGMIFDALDGRIARVTKMSSKFGAQLDSLCDCITFGIAPALILYELFGDVRIIPAKYAIVVSCFYFACTILRLARFNVESTTNESFHSHFSGLPSPAAAGLVCSFVLLYYDNDLYYKIKPVLINTLPFFAMASAVLMVSRIKYTHVVNKLFTGAHNFLNLIEIVLVCILVYLRPEIIVFTFFMTYGLVEPLKHLWKIILHKQYLPEQSDISGSEEKET